MGGAVTLSQGGTAYGRFISNSTATYIGSMTSQPLHLRVNDSVKVTVNNDGNVGIGTTEPAAKLNVSGSTRLEGLFGNVFIEGGEPYFFVGTDSASAEVKLISYNTVISADEEIGQLSFNVSPDSVNSYPFSSIRSFVDGAVGGTTDLPSRLSFYTIPDGSNAQQERMTIKNDGNIGIGTTGPGEELHLYDNNNHDVDLLIEQNGSGFDTRLIFDKAVSGRDALIQFKTAGALNFELGVDSTPANTFKIGRSDNNADFVIDTNGNVGIGTTDPGYALEVVGDIYASGDITCGGTCGGGSSLWTDATTYIYPNNYTDFVITDTGNIGIGTTAPITTLNVIGTIRTGSTPSGSGAYSYGIMSDNSDHWGTTQSNALYAGGVIRASTAVTEYASLRIDGAGIGSGATIGTQYGIYIGAQTNATTNYGIYQYTSTAKNYFAGNVGIGDATPTYKLDVNGTGRFTGTVTADSTLTVAGTFDPNGSITLPTTGVSGAGSGSGLDADLLDGANSSAYNDQTLSEVLTTGNNAGNLELVNVNGIRFGSASSPSSWQIHLSGNGYVANFLRADGGLTTDSTDPGTGNVRVSGALDMTAGNINNIGDLVNVDSTNKVANLNADLLDGFNSSAFGDATLAMQNSIYARVDNAYSSCYTVGVENWKGYSTTYTACVSGWTSISTFKTYAFENSYGTHKNNWRICCLAR